MSDRQQEERLNHGVVTAAGDDTSGQGAPPQGHARSRTGSSVQKRAAVALATVRRALWVVRSRLPLLLENVRVKSGTQSRDAQQDL